MQAKLSKAQVKRRRRGRNQNGNEEIAYRMLWSGKAYSPAEAAEAKAAKERYAKAA
ncbi:MAG: hypothetical protein IT510_17200 [Sulfuritalea sp.]|nr:hypothetical protein [Sulfuritalea sp.]